MSLGRVSKLHLGTVWRVCFLHEARSDTLGLQCEIVALLVALGLCGKLSWLADGCVWLFLFSAFFYEITELFCNISGREVKREAGLFLLVAPDHQCLLTAQHAHTNELDDSCATLWHQLKLWRCDTGQQAGSCFIGVYDLHIKCLFSANTRLISFSCLLKIF